MVSDNCLSTLETCAAGGAGGACANTGEKPAASVRRPIQGCARTASSSKVPHPWTAVCQKFLAATQGATFCGTATTQYRAPRRHPDDAEPIRRRIARYRARRIPLMKRRSFILAPLYFAAIMSALVLPAAGAAAPAPLPPAVSKLVSAVITNNAAMARAALAEGADVNANTGEGRTAL